MQYYLLQCIPYLFLRVYCSILDGVCLFTYILGVYMFEGYSQYSCCSIIYMLTFIFQFLENLHSFQFIYLSLLYLPGRGPFTGAPSCMSWLTHGPLGTKISFAVCPMRQRKPCPSSAPFVARYSFRDSWTNSVHANLWSMLLLKKKKKESVVYADMLLDLT